MEDFGTFQCKGFDKHIRTWRVYADIDPKTLQVDFIRLQYGQGTLPGPALRPNDCHRPPELLGLHHVRMQVAKGHTGEEFEVIDMEDS